LVLLCFGGEKTSHRKDHFSISHQNTRTPKGTMGLLFTNKKTLPKPGGRQG